MLLILIFIKSGVISTDQLGTLKMTRQILTFVEHLSLYILEMLKIKSYPTNSCLHDGIKATLRQINICRYTLHCDDLVELVCVARQ